MDVGFNRSFQIMCQLFMLLSSMRVVIYVFLAGALVADMNFICRFSSLRDLPFSVLKPVFVIEKSHEGCPLLSNFGIFQALLVAILGEIFQTYIIVGFLRIFKQIKRRMLNRNEEDSYESEINIILSQN